MAKIVKVGIAQKTGERYESTSVEIVGNWVPLYNAAATTLSNIIKQLGANHNDIFGNFDQHIEIDGIKL